MWAAPGRSRYREKNFRIFRIVRYPLTYPDTDRRLRRFSQSISFVAVPPRARTTLAEIALARGKYTVLYRNARGDQIHHHLPRALRHPDLYRVQPCCPVPSGQLYWTLWAPGPLDPSWTPGPSGPPGWTLCNLLDWSPGPSWTLRDPRDPPIGTLGTLGTLGIL